MSAQPTAPTPGALLACPPGLCGDKTTCPSGAVAYLVPSLDLAPGHHVHLVRKGRTLFEAAASGLYLEVCDPATAKPRGA